MHAFRDVFACSATTLCHSVRLCHSLSPFFHDSFLVTNIRGFSNPDIRDKLKDSPHLKDIADPRRKSAKVTRIFNRCHAHGLIAKIPHSRRWRVTKQGRIAMTASIQLRDIQFPITHMKLTA